MEYTAKIELHEKRNFGIDNQVSLADVQTFDSKEMEEVLNWLKDKLMFKNATDEDFEKYFSIQHQANLKKNLIDQEYFSLESPWQYLYSSVEDSSLFVARKIYVIHVKDADGNYVNLFED